MVMRSILSGHSGKGISIHEDASTLQQAPLYTRYINKTDEYRVHVFKGVVLDVQRKARDTSVPDDAVNWQVRNHDNGFIFMRDGVTPDTVPHAVIQNSLAVVQCTGLDFGAVDVIWNSTHNKAYVLEVNSSPGMTGTTLDKFCSAVQAYADDISIEQWG